MKNLLGAGRGRADRPEKKGAITITSRCERRCKDLITALLLLLLLERKKEEEEEEEEKEESSQVLFSSGGPCGLGYSRYCWAGYYRDDGGVGARQHWISGYNAGIAVLTAPD